MRFTVSNCILNKILLYQQFIIGFIHSIGQRGSSWFIDYTENIQTRDLTGIFSCLSLRIIEVCGDSYYGILYAGAQVIFYGINITNIIYKYINASLIN